MASTRRTRHSTQVALKEAKASDIQLVETHSVEKELPCGLQGRRFPNRGTSSYGPLTEMLTQTSNKDRKTFIANT